MHAHQYIERTSAQVMTEKLFGDRIVRFLYSKTREHAPSLFRVLTSQHMSDVLGFLNFDMPFSARLLGNKRFLKACGVDLSACVLPAHAFKTPRHIFERQLRYWECRPMPSAPTAAVSPADSRVVVGALDAASALFVKDKFFDLGDLLLKPHWLETFTGGDYAIFRLTPDKYHYNHTPVAGVVLDHYTIGGTYHSCNPGAVIELVTPYSTNKRVVTIIDTNVAGGTQVGTVAMIEVVAMMIGDIVPCYSRQRYAAPQPVLPGLFVEKGVPKSLYRPGSSTDIVLFQQARVTFAEDLLANRHRTDVASRFTLGFGQPLVETEVLVRSLIATSTDHV